MEVKSNKVVNKSNNIFDIMINRGLKNLDRTYFISKSNLNHPHLLNDYLRIARNIKNIR